MKSSDPSTNINYIHQQYYLLDYLLKYY